MQLPINQSQDFYQCTSFSYKNGDTTIFQLSQSKRSAIEKCINCFSQFNYNETVAGAHCSTLQDLLITDRLQRLHARHYKSGCLELSRYSVCRTSSVSA